MTKLQLNGDIWNTGSIFKIGTNFERLNQSIFFIS